jgi:8-oxo-dGTP pyrophosphatase MutT (NUDIX family)
MAAEPKPRTQYAVLPHRIDGGFEVMLISSRETRRWIVPKGWPMKGRSGRATAAIEALEEAGLLGVVADEACGSYDYGKVTGSGDTVPCRVEVHPMRVVRQRATWLESEQRECRWFSREEAAAAVREDGLRDLILRFQPDQAPAPSPGPSRQWTRGTIHSAPTPPPSEKC